MQANYFYGTNFMDWLRLNVCSAACYGSLGIDWSIISLIGLWCLWIRRNRVVFQKAKPSLNLKVEVLAKVTEYVFIGANIHSAPTKSTIQVKWLQPLVNWFKLNSDGSSLGNPGRVGGGGLIRDANGAWIRGYARAIGWATSVAAELWALRDGIQLCISLNLLAVIVELDVQLLVDLLGKANDSSSSNNPILADCKEGLKLIPHVKIKHCFREVNKCADALARHGALLNVDYFVFLSPPIKVLLLVNLDNSGVTFDHSVNANVFSL
ncbi:putative ribonuclease h protein [Quercus suber]|uniref:Ribonuclease h protein n=1 Tax=Quercus suber TaxID=58331 RepID=A0AAW0JRL8_QUESU